MISVVMMVEQVAAARRANAVAQSLTALVPLAVEGFVRDVHIVSAEADRQLAEIAEESGADLHAAVIDALTAAKSPRVILLKAGALVNQALTQEIWRSGLASPGAKAALFFAAPTRLHHFIQRNCVGLLAKKSDLLALSPPDFATARRKIKAPLRLKAALQMVD